ncbi:Transcriptional regulator [Candidatus Roizmanbacteria bacterium]|nr:Transcriptional regulator [Candidatus Roizmanbacteria bacterium]
MISKTTLSGIIGKNLRRLREKKGISQEELAYKSGLYRTYVGHIEVGRYMPSAYTIFKLVKALNIKSSDLLPF